ncbi:MAG: tRNA (N(6)-L-threonylcarbamoyladenosine(37)-C(2))-methylthiotransferase MtaB [Defluviicoccus sp.]|nr:tRNA (N(6)-L-threonylcarbamoyladenosine(37)-C(2))-methylthiotransferase MtaB [Defluviicoccus sp.]
MSAPEIVTFGCRLNALESEIIRRRAAEAGLADAVIVNTCAVTAEAERQARQAIRRARRDAPHKRIVVAGCAAQLDPARYAAMPGVDRVLGNREKLSASSYAAQAPEVGVGDIMAAREGASHLIDGIAGRARAFVQIQQGCDHRCTFCIIPFARGPNRSLAPDAVIAQIRLLADNGYREAVLTGVDITDYGSDLAGGAGLGALVGRILAEVPQLPRLRLSSLDPSEIDAELLRAIAAEERLMPHFHLSVQAGSDLILKRMRRRHSRADVVRFCGEARRLRPDAVFGADLIAGFPTETDAMFGETESLVAEAGLTWLHVFPYSERPGTPAARMPQVPRPLRKTRAAALRRLARDRLARHLETRRGRRERVLVETPHGGRTEQYARIALDRPAAPGSIVAALVTGQADGELRGVVDG